MRYLQFPDEPTAKKSTGWWSKKSGWIAPTPALQIAVRGVLYNDDGVYDETTGECITPPTQRPGFHVDVIYGDIPAAAQRYIVVPDDPDFVLA
ncbi:hypothetical protein FEM41_19985 [Jejubacter calystegiae]|uniref:Uncharacterized protein n=1 Tax=Jejubacter calystegiae TaxID=2579935 RepID=A0A4P8YLU2_9ENTR|nr:hypothetical protein [Jejubacter calystegiae]QCT21770.1 hypothetical protein FEM41_19985 [Jejubacter calystegiae]